MTRATWDEVGTRQYKTGTDRGMLYPNPIGGAYVFGVPWSGLTGVTKSPSGAEPTPVFADNMLWLNMISAEQFAATVEALMYPDEFEQCLGVVVQNGMAVGQQTRKIFAFSWRTLIGTDDNPDKGYEIHIAYGCAAAPSEMATQTVNDTPEATPLSWDLSTTPVTVTGMKPTATMVISSLKNTAAVMLAVENALYGTAGTDPRCPLPDELIAMGAVGNPTTATIGTPPSATSAGVITIPSTTGVQYRRSDTNAVVPAGTVTISTMGAKLGIRAQPLPGYIFSPTQQAYWEFTKTT